MDFVYETKESILSKLFNKKTLKRKHKLKKNRKLVKYENYKKLYLKEKKQNEEYVSLLNNVRDYFGKSWYTFLNDCEEAKQFNDYSRYLVNDILKEDQVDNEIKEVINLTNEEGVDKVGEKEEGDFDYYFKLDKNNTVLLDDCFMQHFEHNHTIDNDLLSGVDENLYTEQVYSNKDLYIDPKVPVDNTENLDQEVNNIENLDDQEVSNYTESFDSDKDELNNFKCPVKIPEDEYDFLNFSDSD
ncbi:6951_t:CDS:2 [Racocetra persica]|uniref:6951_t:CDS:1 n=1 Tax=Racocetra persica TaxID=160502 RepID=A0ACA9MUR2_9GLOM|nr:6951_t:CDS:2 [Racocetra persica]